MSLLTRCPNCATAFRVSDAQLTLRHGKVRCGHCRFVFNARACLVDAAPVTVIDLKTTEASVAAASALENQLEQELDQALAGVSTEATPAEPVLPPAPPPLPAAAPAAPATDNWLKQSGSTWKTWLWSAGNLALGACLFASAALALREPLVQTLPETRDWLQPACQWLHCQIQPPRQKTLLTLEGDELAVDPNTPHRLQLSGVLKNTAHFDQAWPLIHLKLLDANGQLLAERKLLPVEYLSAADRQLAEFPASSEIGFSLPFSAPLLDVANFRVMPIY